MCSVNVSLSSPKIQRITTLPLYLKQPTVLLGLSNFDETSNPGFLKENKHEVVYNIVIDICLDNLYYPKTKGAPLTHSKPATRVSRFH